MKTSEIITKCEVEIFGILLILGSFIFATFTIPKIAGGLTDDLQTLIFLAGVPFGALAVTYAIAKKTKASHGNSLWSRFFVIGGLGLIFMLFTTDYLPWTKRIFNVNNLIGLLVIGHGLRLLFSTEKS